MPARPTSTRRLAVLLALLPALPACASWRVQQDLPQQVILAKRPTRVRLTTTEGQRIVMRRPRAITGILRGYDESCWARLGVGAAQCREIGFLLSEVEVLELRERPPGTNLFIGGAAMAALMMVVYGLR